MPRTHAKIDQKGKRKETTFFKCVSYYYILENMTCGVRVYFQSVHLRYWYVDNFPKTSKTWVFKQQKFKTDLKRHPNDPINT